MGENEETRLKIGEKRNFRPLNSLKIAENFHFLELRV